MPSLFRRSRWVFRYALALILAIFWIVSFMLPAVETSVRWYQGWEIAIIGWVGAILMQFGWYANLIMIPSLGYLALAEAKDSKNAGRLGAALVAFGLNSLFWNAFQWGGSEAILVRGYGFYFWMIAVLGTGAGLLTITWSARRAACPPDPSAGRLP